MQTAAAGSLTPLLRKDKSVDKTRVLPVDIPARTIFDESIPSLRSYK